MSVPRSGATDAVTRGSGQAQAPMGVPSGRRQRAAVEMAVTEVRGGVRTPARRQTECRCCRGRECRVRTGGRRRHLAAPHSLEVGADFVTAHSMPTLGSRHIPKAEPMRNPRTQRQGGAGDRSGDVKDPVPPPSPRTQRYGTTSRRPTGHPGAGADATTAVCPPPSPCPPAAPCPPQPHTPH